MPETTPLIKAALNLRVGAGFDVYTHWERSCFPFYSCMDDLPEVCERHATLPSGEGLEGIRGSHQPYDPCKLDHLQCGTLFPSTVRLLPSSASTEGVPHGRRDPGTGPEGTRAEC